MRFVVLFTLHVTLILKGACLTDVVAYSCDVADELTHKDVPSADEDASNDDEKDARILKFVELVWKAENDCNEQYEKYSEFFERHESSKRQYCHTIRRQNVCRAHYYRVWNDHYNRILSEFDLKNQYEQQYIHKPLYEKCLDYYDQQVTKE